MIRRICDFCGKEDKQVETIRVRSEISKDRFGTPKFDEYLFKEVEMCISCKRMMHEYKNDAEVEYFKKHFKGNKIIKETDKDEK